MKRFARDLVRGGLRRAGTVVLTATLALGLAGGAHAAPAGVPLKTGASTDYTDLWWNPGQSGWGLQMIHTGTFLFVTIYVYGADGKPTWFGGGLSSNGGSTYSGKLYVTTRPHYGLATFNPNSLVVREAGTMTFDAASPNTGLLTYSVDEVAVTKSISRQPLTLDTYDGPYAAVLTQAVSNCGDTSKNGSATYALGLQIFQSGNAMSIDIANPAGDSCTVTGTYTQAGRNGTLDGSYTCASGDSGAAVVSEMNNHVRQFNAKMRLTSSELGCIYDAAMTGLVPN
jgi:hypothetical protein